jgi:hypothetical protein
MPPSVLVPQAAAFAGAGANRNDDTVQDRHVFNLANNAPSLPAAGEHAYSKAKL